MLREYLGKLDGVLIPGGFGKRGMKEKLLPRGMLGKITFPFLGSA
jgi:CTP synthase (UTP-ammonia lyase)